MRRPDLEEDIWQAPWMIEKIRDGNRYAQNLYAAFCNMQWKKTSAWTEKAGELAELDRSDLWTRSWRSSGGLIANFRKCGEDYMDWYCSGMGGIAASYDEDPEWRATTGYVNEGEVTEEVAADLLRLGWVPVPYEN